MAPSFRPIDRFSLRSEGCEHVVGMVFDDLIVDPAPLRPTLGPRLNVNVCHSLASLASGKTLVGARARPGFSVWFDRGIGDRHGPCSSDLRAVPSQHSSASWTTATAIPIFNYLFWCLHKISISSFK